MSNYELQHFLWQIVTFPCTQSAPFHEHKAQNCNQNGPLRLKNFFPLQLKYLEKSQPCDKFSPSPFWNTVPPKSIYPSRCSGTSSLPNGSVTVSCMQAKEVSRYNTIYHSELSDHQDKVKFINYQLSHMSSIKLDINSKTKSCGVNRYQFTNRNCLLLRRSPGIGGN